MKQKLGFIGGLGVVALVASSLASAQTTTTEGPFSVTFDEGRLDIDETQTLPAACTAANADLVSVGVSYSVNTRADLETTNTTSGDTRAYSVTVQEDPLSLTIGSTNVLASEAGGSENRSGTLGAGETAMDTIDPVTDISGSTTITSGLSAFSGGTATVRFVAEGASIVENASNVNSEINHFGQASASVTYTCETAVCPFDSSLAPDDPGCPRCEFDSSLAAIDPLCVPPTPVPGITNYGLIFSLLGLPVIIGLFAARRRMKK